MGGLLGWGLQRGGNTELQDFSVCVSFRARVFVSGSSESSECACHGCVALWARLGNDLLAHCLTSFVSDVTSSGRPSLTSLSELATSPAILAPALSFLYGIYHRLKMYPMSVDRVDVGCQAPYKMICICWFIW